MDFFSFSCVPFKLCWTTVVGCSRCVHRICANRRQRKSDTKCLSLALTERSIAERKTLTNLRQELTYESGHIIVYYSLLHHSLADNKRDHMERYILPAKSITISVIWNNFAAIRPQHVTQNEAVTNY